MTPITFIPISAEELAAIVSKSVEDATRGLVANDPMGSINNHLVDRGYIELNFAVGRRKIERLESEGKLRRQYNPRDSKTAYYLLGECIKVFRS